MTMIAEDMRMIEMHAVSAVKSGRHLATLWSCCPLFLPAHDQHRANATMRNIAEGRVCRRADDETLDQLVDEIAEMLDAASPGYGGVFCGRGTDEFPFVDPDIEEIRRLGEALKAFLRARQSVIDHVVADREIAAVMKERG